MKRLISLAVAASMMLIGTSAFAQASLGAGYINETNKVKIGDNASNMGALNGFYAGFGYDINEGEGFGISTGLYYSFLTGNVSVPSLSVISGDLTEHALNIPVKVGFSVPVGDGLKGFLNAGPTFVCGLSSTIKPLGVDLLKTDLYKHEYLGRFDIMVGASLGAEINDMIRISVGYDLGMLDQFGAGIKGKNDDGSTKDRAYSLNRNRITVGLALLF
ncbi:MAG: outer membrane beta-barrel protein [Bacteroidales bacterium]|nr:outer membrane beta-barrel protein [Bacteroidales bacterium]MBR5073057.1 outer membrane beta-barrel protein [Bacteroidales bacterium]